MKTDFKRSDEVKDSLPLSAADLMARRVISVCEDVSLSGAVELMLENHVSGLPVVDRQGRLRGMISKTDVVRESTLGERAPVKVHMLPSGVQEIRCTTVSDVMTRGAYTVRPDATIQEVALALVESGVHRVAVVDKATRVVGIISTSDVVRWVSCLPSGKDPTTLARGHLGQTV
jgi:CBS-domain-containing membrane protein